MIFLCSRDWLFQAQAGATHLGVAFCNRFAPLEGNLVEEEDDEEEKVALVPSAAKEARWRKWRPYTCTRTSQSSRGADELFDWDALFLSLAPVGAAASPSVSYPRIANTDMYVCMCVCVWQRACSSGSPFAVVASAPSPPLTKPMPWWYAPPPFSASRFH